MIGRLLITISLAVFAVAGHAQFFGGQSASGTHDYRFPLIRWSTVMEGQYSAIEQPMIQVARTSGDWQRMWHAVHANQQFGYHRPAPRFDPMREEMILINLGSRPGLGYQVYVEAVGRNNHHYWQVYVVEIGPRQSTHTVHHPGGPRPQIVTTPYIIISVEKTIGAPQFIFRNLIHPFQGAGPHSHGSGRPPVYIVGKGGALMEYEPPKTSGGN